MPSRQVNLLEGAELENADTVASHLFKHSFKKSSDRRQVWLVDEASLLST